MEEEGEAVELVLFQVSECYVYMIPPRKTAASYRADEWNVNKWSWEGMLKVISKGVECTIRLVDKTGELYARAFLREGEPHPVEAVIDSSRYFVLRVEESIVSISRPRLQKMIIRECVGAYSSCKWPILLMSNNLRACLAELHQLQIHQKHEPRFFTQSLQFHEIWIHQKTESSSRFMKFMEHLNGCSTKSSFVSEAEVGGNYPPMPLVTYPTSGEPLPPASRLLLPPWRNRPTKNSRAKLKGKTGHSHQKPSFVDLDVMWKPNSLSSSMVRSNIHGGAVLRWIWSWWSSVKQALKLPRFS